MIILAAVVLGLVIGFIRKGSLSGIFQNKYSKWQLGLIGVLLQIALAYSCYFPQLPSSITPFLPIVNFVAYLLILIMLIFNLDDIFTIMITVGITANFVVSFINGGFMPVSQSVMDLVPASSVIATSIYAGTNAVYALVQTPGTLLWFMGIAVPISFLKDITYLTASLPGISAGTAFIAIGIMGVLSRQMSMQRKMSAKKNETIIERQPDKALPVIKPEPVFESQTEELFFEDELLPKDPLDNIFGDEDAQKTQVISTVSDAEVPGHQIAETYDPSQETKVINNISDLPDYLIQSSAPEPTAQEDGVLPEGFFTSSFYAEKGLEKAYPNVVKTQPERAAVRQEPTQTKSTTSQSNTENSYKQQGFVPKQTIAEEEDVLNERVQFDPIEFLDEEAEKSVKKKQSAAASRRRGGLETDERTGYIVSSAYKKEMASKDKTEEEMMNVWSQVMEQSRSKKMSRRKQAGGGYTTDNPYQEEIDRKEAAVRAQREAAEKARAAYAQEIKDEAQKHQEQAAKAVNGPEDDIIMTDADRIAAGYEKVSFEISGREVSFWRKKK